MWEKVELFLSATFFRQSGAPTAAAVRSFEVQLGSTSVLICAKIENMLLTGSCKLNVTKKNLLVG